MRWKVLCIGLAAALAAVVGCKQPVFLSEADLNRVMTVPLPAHEKNPELGCKPIIPETGAPAVVTDPDRKIRYMSLAECISIALEQGVVGSPIFGAADVQPYTDSQLNFVGNGVSLTDSIRVLALDPARVGSNIELSLSKFDAIWSTSLSWNTTDRPIATSADLITSGGQTAINTEQATASTAIFKGLPTGGVAGVTFAVPYQLTNLPSAVNPSYTPSVQFAFEQPLLQGFGVEINQLRQSNPTSELLQNASVLGGLPQPGVEGILVTRIRFDQQRAEFQRNVNTMLSNVEYAYWNLYNSYWNLYANEAALRQAYVAWQIAVVKLQAGKIAVADVAQARGQYELFRFNRLQALGGNAAGATSVLEAERQLRGMLGLPVDDGTRLVPSDAPTLAEFHPDWTTALNEALNNDPGLIMAREQIKVDQMNVTLAENALLPDLRLGATYDVNSIGTRLDGGPTTANAFGNLASDHFNNWSVLLRLNVPIGYRNAYANLRIAKLNLARDYANLEVAEKKVALALGRAYQTIFVTYESIKALRAQREAFGEQVKANFQEFQAGKITPDLLLEAQRFWAQALQQEYQAIRDYNNSLAAFELVKGTIPQHDNVVIAEGALPSCAQERAVEHQRRRSAALEVRERAEPVPLAETHMDHPAADVPAGAASHAAALPDLWQDAPPLSDAPALKPQPGEPAVAPMPTMKKPAALGAIQPSVPDLPGPAVPLNPPPGQ
ncbi:MAG TPA: TolC family protein [Gemmataceae bacterium]|nr:TolC family protein [Gemmataceae bacterium]